jgi:6-phosphogluconolactonase (cycloisomerase 2 family)
MIHKPSLACLGALICTTAVLAQVAAPNSSTTAESAPTGAVTTTTTSQVAWVYVSSIVGATASDVYGYSSAPNGSLIRLPGSPYEINAVDMAVNGKYLFGSMLNNVDVNTYLLETDGALRYAATTNVLTPNRGCGLPGLLTLDHSGASLYNFDFGADGCTNNTIEAYQVVKSTGHLTFLGETGDSQLMGSHTQPVPLTFIGNNTFAYGANTYEFACPSTNPPIYGFRRNGNGSLTTLNINPPYPKTSPGSGWCSYLAAADPTNHLAVAMFPLDQGGGVGLPPQLATYTVDGVGNLTTTSTSANMPNVAVAFVNAMAMAPSGKLLAVGGSIGLQVFHFNGAKPITPYTGLIARGNIGELRWDNANHLYAISQYPDKLWVFTVTPTGVSQAPGSPHTINSPFGLIVQPLPRY